MIFVGVLEKVTDEFGTVTWQPQMEGSKAGRELPGIVDQVVSMHSSPAMPRVAGCWTRPPPRTPALSASRATPGGLPAKDRSGRLDLTEPPDLGALLARIDGHSPINPISPPDP